VYCYWQQGSSRLADLLDNPSPAMLARGIPMRQDPNVSIFFSDIFLEHNGKPIPAIVDLGSGLTIINWKAADQVRDL